MYLLAILIGSSLSFTHVPEAPVGKPESLCEMTAQLVLKKLETKGRYACIPSVSVR